MFSFLKHSEKMSYFFTVSRKLTFLKGKPEKKNVLCGGGGNKFAPSFVNIYFLRINVLKRYLLTII